MVGQVRREGARNQRRSHSVVSRQVRAISGLASQPDQPSTRKSITRTHAASCDSTPGGVKQRSTEATARTLGWSHVPATCINSNLPRGRRDRNRTCKLRFWSTRRAVQRRPVASNLPSNSHFLAAHRPAASKNVQPLCSQLYSQPVLHPSAGRRWFTNWTALFRRVTS